MIVADLNVLIYATDTASKFHLVAKPWLDEAMSESETVGLCTAVTVGFVRLVTNPRVMAHPLGVHVAVDIVEQWLRRRNVTAPQPTIRHYSILRELVDATGVGGNLVSDAHLAAIAIEHGATLWSFDSDFSRFPGLVSRRPGD